VLLAPDGKPETLGAAMKLLANGLKTFTVSELIEKIKADADYAKLLEAASATTLYGNLAYWTKTGKLSKDGDGADATYKVINL